MIADSISQFWFRNPIIIDKNNEIIAWHWRLLWAQQLWMETVPCIIADDLTEDQVRAYRLLDNRIGDFGEYNIESIMDELKDIWNLQLWLESLDNLFTDLLPEKENEKAEEDDYEVPEEIKTDIVIGDLFEIGEHRLLCGDSTDAEQVALLMNWEKADMVFTDPPYWMFLDTDYSGRKNDFKSIWKSNSFEKVKCNSFEKVKWDSEDFNPEFVLLPLREFSYCKEIFLWWADYYAEYIADVKNNWSWIVWDKSFSESENIDKMYWSNFELCWSKAKHKRELARVKRKWLFWILKDDTKKRVHPTQKPAILAEWFFDKWGSSTKLVVDLFWGSWSTMAACHKTKRKCYMQEFDPKYCQVIIDRMIKLDPTLEIKKNWLPYNQANNG